MQPPAAGTSDILIVKDVYRDDRAAGFNRSNQSGIVRKAQISSKPEKHGLHSERLESSNDAMIVN